MREMRISVVLFFKMFQQPTVKVICSGTSDDLFSSGWVWNSVADDSVVANDILGSAKRRLAASLSWLSSFASHQPLEFVLSQLQGQPFCFQLAERPPFLVQPCSGHKFWTINLNLELLGDNFDAELLQGLNNTVGLMLVFSLASHVLDPQQAATTLLTFLQVSVLPLLSVFLVFWRAQAWNILLFFIAFRRCCPKTNLPRSGFF